MDQRYLAAGAAVLGLALAGCGGDKSNREKAYAPPAKTTQQASGDATQQDAEAKAQGRELVTGVEACFVDQQDYSACKKPEGVSVQMGSGAGQAEVTDAATATYTVVAHSKSGTSFEAKKGDSGEVTRSCDKPGTGGCPDSGKW